MSQSKLSKVINKSPLQQAYEELTAQGALAKKLNARRDINTTQDFVFWEAKDSVINDFSAFTDLNNGNWNRYEALNSIVSDNRATKANFLGDTSFDYDKMSTADIAYYESFLGFVKKAVNSVGHAVGSAAKSVAHATSSVALDIAHGSRDVAVGAAHDVRTAATDVNKVGADLHKEAVKLHNAQDKEIDKVLKGVGHGVEGGLKAAAPYWKEIVVGATIAVLAATGVGLVVAIPLLSAELTALSQIKPAVPYLTPEAGDGGGGDSGDDGDDTGEAGDDQSTDQSQAYDPAAAQAQADAEAQAAEASHKKKLIYIAAGVVAIIGIIWWIKKHKK